jgi:large subunit ribosomal protein L6
MSRIGNKQIEIPDKVKVNLTGEGTVNVEGPKGKLAWTLPKQIKGRSVDNKHFLLERSSEDRGVKALHGLSRSLVSNMVAGVSTGFVKELEIQGVGFKAAVQGAILNLNLGFSHPIHFPIPQGIKITVTENTKLKVEGIDKQLVGQVAADIRGYYPPEPYKGKGVRYAGEQIIRKEGKTVQ